MTERRDRFCRHVVAGKSEIEAYRLEYSSRGSDAAVRANAYKLARSPDIQQRIAELRAEVIKKSKIKWDLEKAMTTFYNMLEKAKKDQKVAGLSKENVSALVQAADRLNRLAGVDAEVRKRDEQIQDTATLDKLKEVLDKIGGNI